MNYELTIMNYKPGGLAQLARAPALQAGGQRFESVILHSREWSLRKEELLVTIMFKVQISKFKVSQRSLTY